MNKITPLYPLLGIVSGGLFLGTIFGFYKLNKTINVRNVEPTNLKQNKINII